MQDNQPQPVDVVALQQQIVGLQNQRNAAFNDAADLFGKLQSANNIINQLVAELNKPQPQLNPAQPLDSQADTGTTVLEPTIVASGETEA